MFSSMITVTIQVTSTLQSMKQWNLSFFFLMVFTGRESVNSLSTLFRMGGGSGKGDVSRNTFWLLILILFPHSCRISGSYLVPISNYWTWTKTTPQKNRFFWSNPYKIWVMITSFIKMLSSYLAPISNFWTWTKTTPQKNRFFWSNPYKIWVMITSFIKMLD